MVRRLHQALLAWADDDAVSHVLIRGEGRAFSAGGDILAIYQGGMAGNPPTTSSPTSIGSCLYRALPRAPIWR